MEDIETKKDEGLLKKLNAWLIVMGVFLTVYTSGLFLLVEHKTNKLEHKTVQTAAVNYTNGMIYPSFTNLFPYRLLFNPPAAFTSTNSTNITGPVPLYEEKPSYELYEFVLIKYFHKAGIVVEKLPNDKYVVMYKTHEHQLLTVTVSKEMLIVPNSYKAVNPFALID